MSNANEPAFPISAADSPNSEAYWGLDKREYFAAMAMQGLCAGCEWMRLDHDDAQKIVVSAVRAADALLAELAK